MAGTDAFGTQWAISDDGGSTFDDVAEVTSVDVLDMSADTLDVSSHDSPGQWREFIAGMKDAGELSMDINYNPAVHGTITALLGGSAVAMKITLTDGGAAVVTFDGIVTGFSAQAPYDDKLSGSVTIKVTGAVTITP